MRMRHFVVVAAVVLGFGTGSFEASAQPAGCNRPCLAGVLDEYLGAVVANDP
jgi:hypothetical protein